MSNPTCQVCKRETAARDLVAGLSCRECLTPERTAERISGMPEPLRATMQNVACDMGLIPRA